MSKISFEVFAERFANDLGIKDDLRPDISFANIPQYDSMGKINVSLIIEELFEFQIEFEELDAAKTLNELYQYCISKE
ncbi:MAG: hypothetical protein HOG49_29000 [Candidatus Scalindua sp.]|jgi:acyl carrier protein|nr:hypothetical protein [Candidatus Scalindua sp.]